MSDYEHALAMQTKPRLIKEIERLREEVDKSDSIGAMLLGEGDRYREALEALVEYMEESDPYPTSDEHPLYAARAALHPEPSEED